MEREGREGGREGGEEGGREGEGNIKTVGKPGWLVKMAKMCGHIRSINDRFPKVCSIHSTATENMHDPD